jgi:hypothetical protein
MAASPAGNAARQGQALARGRPVPQQGVNAFLGAVYGVLAGRRVHRDAGSTATVPRLPYAGMTRGRHVAGAAAARARRAGRGDVGWLALLKFVYPVSKFRNSKKCQLS